MGKDAGSKLYTQVEVEAIVATANAPWLAKIEALELRIAKMQRDSSTSSKPPSSDITKPPKGGAGGGGSDQKLKRSGQPGHKKYEREFFEPDEIDRCWSYTVDDEEGLEPIAEDDPDEEAWRVVQQIEWADLPPETRSKFCEMISRSWAHLGKVRTWLGSDILRNRSLANCARSRCISVQG